MSHLYRFSNLISSAIVPYLTIIVRLIEWLIDVRLYVSFDIKKGHVGDILSSQSFGVVSKKLSQTQQKHQHKLNQA